MWILWEWGEEEGVLGGSCSFERRFCCEFSEEFLRLLYSR